MANDLTIILSTNKLVVFDELLPNNKRTIIDGDDNTNGAIIIDAAHTLTKFIHRCISARERGTSIQTVLDTGKIITFK